MGYIRLKINNYIAISERNHKMIEVEAANLNEACKKAQEYFENKYGVIEHIVVMEVPEIIGILS